MTMSETIGVCANEVPPMTARQRLIVVLLLGANFMLSADFSILNIALPAVGEAVGLKAENLPWVSTAFALPAAGLSLLFGRLGDLYGRRRIFLTGLFLPHGRVTPWGHFDRFGSAPRRSGATRGGECNDSAGSAVAADHNLR